MKDLSPSRPAAQQAKAPPQEVRDQLKNEDGDELEIVEHELPKIYEPDPQLREDE